MTRTSVSSEIFDTYRGALVRLRSAQKGARGGPPYSIFVNRPLGRLCAAAAYCLRLTPNQVTGLSGIATFAGIVVLALHEPTLGTGIAVAGLLVLGYALDSADGQLARLRGGGSLLGEWLDHTLDSVKVGAVHIAVLLTWYRYFELAPSWMLVPLAFALVSQVHFFGMILIELLTRSRRAALGLAAAAKAPVELIKTLLKLPTDYGILCLAFVFLGAHGLFLWLYALLALATAGYTLLVVFKWRRDAIALDALLAAKV